MLKHFSIRGEERPFFLLKIGRLILSHAKLHLSRKFIDKYIGGSFHFI